VIHTGILERVTAESFPERVGVRMHNFPVFGAAAPAAVRALMDVAPGVGASVLGSAALFLDAVAGHLEAGLADGHAVPAEGYALLFKGFRTLRVEGDGRGDPVPLAESVGGHIVMGRVQAQLGDVRVQECLCGEVGMHEASGVVHGGRVQQGGTRGGSSSRPPRRQ